MRDVIPLESIVRQRPRKSAGPEPASVRPLRPSPQPVPFPRPSPLFTGREEELGRSRRLLAQSPLLLAYGLPGIGKTEFMYRLVAELRATARWRRARPILLRAQAGQRPEELLARLCGLLRTPPALHEPPALEREEPAALVTIARCLDRTPHLVFIDDMQHLDATVAAEVLSYLARRSGASRLLVASRSEVTLRADTPPAAVVRLGPLSAAESAALATELAAFQGTSLLDAEALLARSCGSPRRLHALLQTPPGLLTDSEEPLRQLVRQLPPAGRELLLLARVLDGKLPAATWQDPALRAAAELEELAILVRHQLIEIEQWTIPDLVFAALSEEVSAAELQRAHQRAAQLHLQLYADDPAAAGAAAAALCAVEHRLAAGEPWAAWQTFQHWAPGFYNEQLATAALALAPIFRRELPAAKAEIDLQVVRLLIGQGQLEPAQVLLRQIIGATDPAAAEQGMLLAGHVAQRAGQLSRAEELFCLAAVHPGSDWGRFLAGVHRAELAALRGEAAHARSLLDALAADAHAAAPLSGAPGSEAGRLRAACARVWMELLLGHPAAAAQAAEAALGSGDFATAGGARRPRPADDPEGRLLALTALAHSGCGALAAARRTLEQVRLFASMTGAPAAHAVALCAGFVLLAAGQPAAARAPLQHAYGVFSAQQDLLPAAGAALALGECSLALGELAQAAEQLGEAGRAATRAGSAPLQGLASALRASALLAAGRTESALLLSAAVLGSATGTPRARAIARSVRWRIYALAGDTERAVQELEVAGAEAAESEQEILIMRHELEQAEFTAAHGSPATAIEHAERARQFFTARGLQHEAARAQLALALALITHRVAPNPSRGQEFLTEASELATRRGYAPLLLTAALLEAAVAHERGDGDAVREPLERALAQYPAAAHGLAAQPLRAALAGLDSGDWSGHAALLRRLGLLPSQESPSLGSGPIELRSPSGRQLLTPDAARSERTRFELAIDLDRSEIFVRATGRLVSGRPLMCSLLSQLVTAGLAGADSERLFREVWKGSEYHPLRHRNTIHVALTRLRQLLRELVPERDLIETTASGWRLAPESSLCTLRTARA